MCWISSRFVIHDVPVDRRAETVEQCLFPLLVPAEVLLYRIVHLARKLSGTV